MGAPPTRCSSAWPWGLTPPPSSILEPLQCGTYSPGGVQARAPRNIHSLSPPPLPPLAVGVNKDYTQTLSVPSAYWKKEGGENPLFFLPPSKLMRNRQSRVQELPATFLLPVLGGTAASWFQSEIVGASAHLSGYFPASSNLETERVCQMLTQGECPQADGLWNAGQARTEMEPGQDYARPDWAAASQEKRPRHCSSTASREARLSRPYSSHARMRAHTTCVHNSKNTGER